VQFQSPGIDTFLQSRDGTSKQITESYKVEPARTSLPKFSWRLNPIQIYRVLKFTFGYDGIIAKISCLVTFQASHRIGWSTSGVGVIVDIDRGLVLTSKACVHVFFGAVEVFDAF